MRGQCCRNPLERVQRTDTTVMLTLNSCYHRPNHCYIRGIQQWVTSNLCGGLDILLPQVILAVTRAMFYLSSGPRIGRAVPALLRLVDSSPEVERTVLPYLFSISCKSPVRPQRQTIRAFETYTHFQTSLSLHYTKFFIRSNDLRVIKLGKLRILRSILNVDNHQILLNEFIVGFFCVDRKTFRTEGLSIM